MKSKQDEELGAIFGKIIDDICTRQVPGEVPVLIKLIELTKFDQNNLNITQNEQEDTVINNKDNPYTNKSKILNDIKEFPKLKEDFNDLQERYKQDEDSLSPEEETKMDNLKVMLNTTTEDVALMLVTKLNPEERSKVLESVEDTTLAETIKQEILKCEEQCQLNETLAGTIKHETLKYEEQSQLNKTLAGTIKHETLKYEEQSQLNKTLADPHTKKQKKISTNIGTLKKKTKAKILKTLNNIRKDIKTKMALPGKLIASIPTILNKRKDGNSIEL
jgi:hypothetical protein